MFLYFILCEVQVFNESIVYFLRMHNLNITINKHNIACFKIICDLYHIISRSSTNLKQTNYLPCSTGEPEIIYEDKYDETMVLKAGATIMLPVTVTGFPTPTSKWFHGDMEMFVSDKVTMEVVDNRITLTVKGVSSSNAGTYKIVAENKVGSDSAEFVIKIKGMVTYSGRKQ